MDVQMFGKFCLRQSDEQTDRYKTPNVVNSLMSLLKIKFDLCEGGSFSPTIFKFKSDMKLSVYHISCFISVCPFVAVSKAKFAKNLHCFV